MIAMIGDVGQQEDLEAAHKKALATGRIHGDGRRSARRIRARVHLADAARWSGVRTHVLAGHVDGAAGDRQATGGNRIKTWARTASPTVAPARATIRCASSWRTKRLRPNVQIIAPWREWEIDSREDAIAYAQRHNVAVEQSKKNIYSRDRNIWHLSHEGGVLEDPANSPEEAMWQWIVSPQNAPDKPEEWRSGSKRARRFR